MTKKLEAAIMEAHTALHHAWNAGGINTEEKHKIADAAVEKLANLLTAAGYVENRLGSYGKSPHLRQWYKPKVGTVELALGKITSSELTARKVARAKAFDRFEAHHDKFDI